MFNGLSLTYRISTNKHLVQQSFEARTQSPPLSSTHLVKQNILSKN